jgi:hypothetical protein
MVTDTGLLMRPGALQVRAALRVLAVLAAAMALAMVTGCGGSDDDAAGTGPSSTVASGDPPGNGDGEAASKAQSGADGTGPALTGVVEQARDGAAAVGGVYEDFAAAVQAGVAATDVSPRETLDAASRNKSLASVCDLMSEQAKRQTVEYAKRSARLADVKWTCETATGLLLRRARQAGGLRRTLRARIVGVNADGDRATASVRFGGKGPISSVSLVKEDGDWKLAATPSGDGSK